MNLLHILNLKLIRRAKNQILIIEKKKGYNIKLPRKKCSMKYGIPILIELINIDFLRSAFINQGININILNSLNINFLFSLFKFNSFALDKGREVELDDPCVVILGEFIKDVEDKDWGGGFEELDHLFIVMDYGVMERGLEVEVNFAEKVKLGGDFGFEVGFFCEAQDLIFVLN